MESETIVCPIPASLGKCKYELANEGRYRPMHLLTMDCRVAEVLLYELEKAAKAGRITRHWINETEE